MLPEHLQLLPAAAFAAPAADGLLVCLLQHKQLLFSGC
jgi:hypothetical protein